MRTFTFLAIFLFTILSADAQYWFGPKAGVSLSSFKYQSPRYTEEDVKVSPTFNFEAGGVVIYQASELFSVHGELYYEQIRKDLESRFDLGYDASSSTTNHFISAPMLFRMTFGRTPPVHYYVNGGIKMRFWVAGKGQINGGESEFEQGLLKYDKVVFQQSKSDIENGVVAVPQANIMQFGLAVGGGFYLDLITKCRLQVDFRYYYGHSNMGFNGNPDLTVGIYGYNERMSYRNNTFSVSVSYLFEFDQQLQRKGRSTNAESNKKKGHKK
ncbi:PorT family protein [Marinoscillum sp. MHG1-6]|uniref:PorT family protein n=1 Tax=Marinoscillum sp. MHG1-6 TaxID=2959627 RepID=UPI0021575EC2|nr:PorT family protein [Marinoscillum sp. MHG1-6]